MNTDGFLKFIGWASLTFTWLHTNLLFFGNINEHNEHIRKQAIEEYNESLISDDENESEDG